MKISIEATRSELPLLASLIPALAIDPELFRPLVSGKVAGEQITVENLAGDRAVLNFVIEVTE